jgi:TonB family protein
MGRIVALLASGALAGGGLWAQGTGDNYQGATVLRAGGIQFPANSSVAGLVTLRVRVNGTGAVQEVANVGDLPPLTAAAKEGVKNWTFAAAMKGGSPVEGELRIYVVFNPFNPADVSIPTPPPAPVQAPSGAKDEEVFRPAEAQKATYAVYPANTVASGTVALDVRVGADGSLAGVKVLGGEAGIPLSGAATRAIRGWAFAPGSYSGKAAATRVVVAFVFASPAQGTQ